MVALAGCSNRHAPAPDAPAPESAPETAAPSPTTAPSKRPGKTLSAFAAARSWALYYGPATPDMTDRLGVYDLVVVDPAALGANPAEAIAALKARGCTVVGYLSAVELAPWHEYRDRVSKDWALLVDGKPWVPWGGTDVSWASNYAVSLAVPEWRALLVEVFEKSILGCGCDGVFFDTLEDLDWPALPPEESARQREGLGELLRSLRTAHPDAILIANRTLGATLDVVAEFGDGVCWEDFALKHFDNPETRPWMECVAAKLRQCIDRRRNDRPFRVLSLWNVDKAGDDIAEQQKRMRERSAEYGFLPFCMVGGYHRLQPPAP